jgi:hypothetical protein
MFWMVGAISVSPLIGCGNGCQLECAMITSVLSSVRRFSAQIIRPDQARFMQIAVGYFDESTDEDTQGVCYVVAGFLTSNLASVTLELRWRDLLNKYHLDYFKASELSAGEGQFKQFRDDPSCQKWTKFSDREKAIFDEIKTAFTDAIIGVNGLTGIGAALILPDYENLIRNYAPSKNVLSRPYFVCSGQVLMEAGLRIARENESYRDGEKIWLRPVFDSHETYSGTMKEGFDWFGKNNPLSSQYMLPPYYEDDTRYLTLQAADNLAFEVRKIAIGVKNNSKASRKSITRLAETGNIGIIYMLDYDGLKLLVDNHDPYFHLKPLSYTLADIIRP